MQAQGSGALAVAARLVGESAAVVVQGEGVEAIVDIGVQQGQVEGVGVPRQPAQAQAGPAFVAVVGVIAVEEVVLVETVALVLMYRDAVEQAVLHQGAGARQSQGVAVVVADPGLQAQARLSLGGGTADADQARQGVGAVQRTLGAAQDLHLFDVEQAAGGAETAEIHAVHQEADGSVQRLLVLAALADAAHLEEARPGGAPGEVQIGNRVEDVFQVVGRALAHGLGADHAGARRLVEQGGIPQAGGDNDFFQGLGCRGQGCREDQCRQSGLGRFEAMGHGFSSTTQIKRTG